MGLVIAQQMAWFTALTMQLLGIFLKFYLKLAIIIFPFTLWRDRFDCIPVFAEFPSIDSV